MPESAEGEVRPFQKKQPSGADCPHCELWEIDAEEDLYCSFCGSLLLDVSVVPDDPILIARINPHRVLVFSNESPKPVKIHIVPGGRTLPWLAFEPGEKLEVAAGKKATVKVRILEEKLPSDLVVESLDYLCRIDQDPRKALPLRITVRSAPRPELLTKELHFGRLEEGKAARKPLRLRNSGGVPLSLKEVRPEGSRQLFVTRPESLPLRIEVGETVEIDVGWDASREDEGMPGEAAGFRLLFENHPDPLVVPARARLYRVFLHLDKSEIRVDPALPKHSHVDLLRLENRGTMDIGIGGIQGDQPWIDVVTEPARFNLKARESVTEEDDTSELVDPTLPSVSSSFPAEVLLHPQGLAPGRHRGRIRVLGLDPEAEPIATVDVELHVVPADDYRDYLGIDFGTTNSVIAYLDPESQEPTLIEDSEVGTDTLPHLIPSILVFQGSARRYVIGREARNRMAAYPEHTIRSIKRLLGVRKEREFFGSKLSASHIAGLLLTKLIERAERRLLEVKGRALNIQRAIVTVPANFFGQQIWGILEACKLAGLDVEDEKAAEAAEDSSEDRTDAIHPGIILDEPSAAALFYLQHLENLAGAELTRKAKRKRGLNLVVFDYGGGTLDVSVARVNGLEDGAYGLTILANVGNNEIGGDSLDLMLMVELLHRVQRSPEQGAEVDDELISCSFRSLRERAERESWPAQVLTQILSARRAWKDAAEKAKVDLSGAATAEVRIAPEALIRFESDKLVQAKRPSTVRVTRDELEILIGGALEEATNLVRHALRVAKVKLAEVDYVLHTGRQSLMPAARERVRALFSSLPEECDILEEAHVKVCVAKGAALYGALKQSAGSGGLRFLNEGRRLPHSYGFEKTLGMTQRMFVEVIPKGNPYPIQAEEEVPPKELAGKMYNLRVYQNSGLKKRIQGNPEICLLGQATIDTLADNKPGCDLKFVVDANRKLQVFADGEPVEIRPEGREEDDDWMW